MEKLFTAEKIANALEKMFLYDHFIQWDGTNLGLVLMFAGKCKEFDNWFKSFEEYEQYVRSHDNIFKLYTEDGSYYYVPVGGWLTKAPDGKCYAFGEGVRFIFNWQAEMQKAVDKIVDGIEIPIMKEEEPITFYYPEDPFETEVVEEGNSICLRRKLDENGNPIWKKNYKPHGHWATSTAKEKIDNRDVKYPDSKNDWVEKFKKEVDKWKK